jgi:hypothetical protein
MKEIRVASNAFTAYFANSADLRPQMTAGVCGGVLRAPRGALGANNTVRCKEVVSPRPPQSSGSTRQCRRGVRDLSAMASPVPTGTVLVTMI